MRILNFFFTFLISLNTFAEQTDSCRFKDNLRPVLGEVRNRNAELKGSDANSLMEFGWCFAYAAADLVTDEVGTRVSAVHLGIRYFEEEFEYEKFRTGSLIANFEIPHAGWPSMAIKAALDTGGFCTEKSIRSDNLGLIGIDGAYSVFEFLNKPLEFRSDGCSEASSSVVRMFAGAGHDDIYTIMQKSSGIESWPDLLEKSCEPVKSNFKKSDIKTSSVDLYKTPANLLKTVDKVVSDGKLIIVAFDPGTVLSEADRSPVAHAAVVIRRERNVKTGECQYILRDNSGKACVKGMEGKCTDGYIQMPREELQKRIKSVSHIDRSKNPAD